jgi:hypothetical protein
MKALKLTPKQKEIFDLLSSMKGAVLFKHVKPTGLVTYRVLDASRNPVMNVRMGLVDELISKQLLERTENHEYILRATTEEKMDISKLGLVKS